MTKFFKQKNKNNSGFTLVETLVAISIFTIAILALMSVLSKGVSDTNYAKKRMTATYLAQEGIEHIRNMRDTLVLSSSTQDGWDSFWNKVSLCTLNNPCGFYDLVSATDSIFICASSTCSLNLINGNYSYNLTGENSGFERKIWVDLINPNEFKIYSSVSWRQGSGNYEVTFSENLYNWIE